MAGALTVRSPMSGLVIGMGQVPDPVFAESTMGPGLAVDPGDGAQTIVAPVRGRVTVLRPHAFVVQVDDGRSVLVHLGIDTVALGGETFDVHVSEGRMVEDGEPMIAWDVPATVALGNATICPVIAVQAEAGAVRPACTPGTRVDAGTPLFVWDA